MSAAPTTTPEPLNPPAKPKRRPLRRPDWYLIGGLVLLALFLLPTLHAGFRADDTWSAETRGTIELGGNGFFDYMWNNAVSFWKSGRPNPIGPVFGSSLAWAIGNHPVLTHAVLNLLTVIAAWLLYALVREFGLSRPGALLTIILVAGTIQLRSYHDSVTGYWGVIQLQLIFVLLSLLLFTRGLKADSRKLLIWSFVAFIPVPLLYEAAYPLVALHLAIALAYRRGWAAIRVAAPFLVVGVVFLFLSVYLRSVGTLVAGGYAVGGGPWDIFRTFLIQLFAPIPGSTLLLRADYASFIPLGGSPTSAELLAGFWRGAVVAVAVAVVGWSMAKRDGSRLPVPGVSWRLAAVGVLLITMPVLIVSAAPKYQMELVAGKGHITVIMQVFGWGVLMMAALIGLIRAARTRSPFATAVVIGSAALVLGFGAGVDGYNNLRVVALELPVTKTRNLLENATADGAFKSVPDGGSLVFSPQDLGWPTGSFAQAPWTLESLLWDRGGRHYDAQQVTVGTRYDCRTETEAPECVRALEPDAAWARVRLTADGGTVIVGRIAGGPRGMNRATTRDITAYVRNDAGGEPVAPVLIANERSGRRWSSRGVSWTRQSQGDGWAIYHADLTGASLPMASTLDDSQARFDFTNPGTPGQIVRVFGTKDLLP